MLVRNFASIGYFREQLPHARLIGDFSLNVANELTADAADRGPDWNGSCRATT